MEDDAWASSVRLRGMKQMMQETRKDALAMITSTIKYSNRDDSIRTRQAAETARTAFMMKAEGKGVRYESQRHGPYYQIIPAGAQGES